MEEDDNDGGGPSRKHMETIVNYVTMTTDISLKWDGIKHKILYEMQRFIDYKNQFKLRKADLKTEMKEIIKGLHEKIPENCLQILVDVLDKCWFLKNTGWKEKPDPISALLVELRESISVIERLMESVKESDVNKVKQLLSQYPIPQDTEHITRKCCLLSLERRDLTLVKFLYQEYRSLLYNVETVERFLTEAVRVDFTEGVRFLISQGLPKVEKILYTDTSEDFLPEKNINYNELVAKAKSVDMLKLLLSEEKIRKKIHDENLGYGQTALYHQILNSSTKADCMSRVQILLDAGARVENLIAKTDVAAWLKIIKQRWFQELDYLLNLLKDINYTNISQQNILHVIFGRDKVRNNVLYIVRKVVERGIDINSVDQHGETPLMLSCGAGYYDVAKYLSERGADVNMVSKYGETAIMSACEGGHKDIVEYLIQHDGTNINKADKHGRADVNKVDNEGRTALMKACKKGYKDIAEYLIQDCGADVNMVDKEGQTALMWACKKGSKDIAEYLIKHCGAEVNKGGRTALMFACEKGSKDVVEYLIQHGGADVNKVDNGGGSALSIACIRGYKDVVEYLIQHGRANVNMVDNEGKAALMWACEGGNKDMVEYLIQKFGADVNMEDRYGGTAFILTCKRCHTDIVEYLIQHGGADVNKVDRDGRTVLMWACMKGNKYTVEYLIQHGGADVNKVDRRGKTALMWACEEGKKNVVEYLIQHGVANVNKQAKNGRTALMKACQGGYKDIVEYLILRGRADVNELDNDGGTALYYCLYKSSEEIMFIPPNFQEKMTFKDVNVLFKFLVESGADLSLPSNGVRLFEKILDRNIYGLFLFVISLKPEIVDVTDKGENILHLLAKVNYDFTVGHFDWLFDGHVDINRKNTHTDTPLMVAAVLLNEKYLEVFTNHPAVDLNKQNKHGHTALHCLILGFTESVQGNRKDEGKAKIYCEHFYPMYMRCVDSLLGARTDVNVQDNEGRTVLMMAVRENDKQLVRKLLDAGAMVDKVDRSGKHAVHYVDFSDSIYDLTIFFLISPSGENHLLDLPCIHGNTLLQTVLQFPPKWKPCKVVAFVRWLVSRNCSLRYLRGRTGHSTYNQLSLDDFSCSQRQNLRELLYRSGAPKEEIISTVNFQAEDEADNAIFHSRNREMFEQSCLNVSLEAKCIRVCRQFLGTEIRAKLPGLEIPHLNKFLLLEDVVGDGDDGVHGGFDELEDESDSCSYFVDKDRTYFHYLGDGDRARAYGFHKFYNDDYIYDYYDSDDERLENDDDNDYYHYLEDGDTDDEEGEGEEEG